jgi:hypothetical protein
MTEIELTSDAWTAIRRGDIFCSPRCGFDCTHAAFMRAMSEGDALADELGLPWKPRIWENCGWHYEVGTGVCRITVNLARGGAIKGNWTIESYTAWINTTPQFISDRWATPQEAFGHALSKMRAAFDQLKNSFEETRKLGSNMAIEALK